MLPVKKYVIDLIDSRVESFDLRQQMSNYIPRQATECCNGGEVKGEEVGLCHSTIPNESSLGFNQRKTGGKIEAMPA
jgi:hypothetical protein